MPEGQWADVEGKMAWIGNFDVPIAQMNYEDVCKFLASHGFDSVSVASTPVGSTGREVFQHKDGRELELEIALNQYGLKDLKNVVPGQSGESVGTVNNIGDLVKYVTLGRDPQTDKSWVSKPMGEYADWQACKDAGNTDAYCGKIYWSTHGKSEELLDKIAKRLNLTREDILKAEPPNRLNSALFRLSKYLAQAQSEGQVQNSYAQNPTAGGQARMDTPTTEEWNMWRAEDLPEPDEVEAHIDPWTGEIRLIEVPLEALVQPLPGMAPPMPPVSQIQPQIQPQVQPGQGAMPQTVYPPLETKDRMGQPVAQQPQLREEMASVPATQPQQIGSLQSIQQPRNTNSFFRFQQRPTKGFKEGTYRTFDAQGHTKRTYGRLADGKDALQSVYFPKREYTRETAIAEAKRQGLKVGMQPRQQANMGVPVGPMKVDPGMPAYAGGPAPRQAMGSKSLFPAVFCDNCHRAAGTYVEYKGLRICKGCMSRLPSRIVKIHPTHGEFLQRNKK